MDRFGTVDPPKPTTGAGSERLLAQIGVLQGVEILHTISLQVGSGSLYGHTAKLQPRSPQAPAAPCVRLLAVPLPWNFRHRFGVPVLACSQIVSAGGHPDSRTRRLG